MNTTIIGVAAVVLVLVTLGACWLYAWRVRQKTTGDIAAANALNAQAMTAHGDELRLRQQKRDTDWAELLSLVYRTLRGDAAAAIELRNDRWIEFVREHGNDTLAQQYMGAVEFGKDYIELSELGGETYKQFDLYRNTQQLNDRVISLTHVIRALGTCRPATRVKLEAAFGQSRDDLVAVLNELVGQLLAHYLEGADKGSREAFEAARRLLDATADLANELFGGTGVLPLATPEGWDWRVMRYVTTPTLDDFRHQPTERELVPWRVRTRAADALFRGDMLDALKVLAICQAYPAIREVVGGHADRLDLMLAKRRHEQSQHLAKPAPHSIPHTHVNGHQPVPVRT